MYIWKRIKLYFYTSKKQRLRLSFPVYCKIHGVKKPDYQGAIVQSRTGDKLQIVHVPLPQYPYNVYVYSATLNRVMGYLQEDLAEKLIELFGKRFCRDAVVENITGGGEYAYRGCNIRILETCVFMLNCKDFSVLRGN